MNVQNGIVVYGGKGSGSLSSNCRSAFDLWWFKGFRGPPPAVAALARQADAFLIFTADDPSHISNILLKTMLNRLRSLYGKLACGMGKIRGLRARVHRANSTHYGAVFTVLLYIVES